MEAGLEGAKLEDMLPKRKKRSPEAAWDDPRNSQPGKQKKT